LDNNFLALPEKIDAQKQQLTTERQVIGDSVLTRNSALS
jgi:hypothetical protein